MSEDRRREKLEVEIRTAHAEISALVHEMAMLRKAGISDGEREQHLERLLDVQADRIGMWIKLAISKPNSH